MHIEHVALWTRNLEDLKAFYETYFQAVAGPKYENSNRLFESFFLSFASGARLEIMRLPTLHETTEDAFAPQTGYVHIAFSVGSQAKVDALTAQLHDNGYTVIDEPQYTGDGYYESSILDPDGNRIEITI